MEGATLGLAECLRMELNLIHGCFEQGDFLEGIRALIVDKDNDPTLVSACLGLTACGSDDNTVRWVPHHFTICVVDLERDEWHDVHRADARVRIPIDPAREREMAGREGRDVILGVRPEDVSLAAGEGSPPSAWPLAVDAVEPMGNETIVYRRY